MPKIESKEVRRDRAYIWGKITGTLLVLGSEENPWKGFKSIETYVALDHSQEATAYLGALKPYAILCASARD
ncbi:hypothetical protein [Methanosarcina sp. UBA411]|jgi:hypothetical protein|uniref:hypothetical protein n=1 Tax=Methanosarcina sp. UBA411 TaxID=1915589 RepID=UPI0025D4DAB6|nr:hypothetical protein [Methanosarcina sp. UBA411]